ncbi:acyltransferase family protein [Proteus mirabilis]|uniref:acyltransferase family protein n=6 Tax=Proteus mirabilis TaxID=584 RepID=UPI0019196092|nr:acyltransferase family protein [Proteus mirabilis]MDF7240670.1 acyltransferase [Proteus mirabilis]MDF7356209.1 acyltransferase [Proteus mirabilis]MDM3628987.1 acyltransferase family protein [Proteus mirabilis]MDM3639691.1 acyltransferase family protein [Proteus mirabilis]MDM3647343.1 acyltransferase family protein [Proteus mirabilis]
MQSKKFRADINGLRAIAVLSVMFFHFNQGLVPGGFAGVDVFFVISGFLMTSIIFRGLESNNFSLWSFLKARARRIVPALVTVISIVLALGYLFFEPLTYQLVGKHGFSSLLFISNITYANEAGYFDADSFSKLFLHTWSLSVEWQFYIVYPIVLIILSKLFSIKTLKKIVVISAIIIFVFCVYFSSINKTLSYFMIYTRGWEMLFGSIAFLFPLSIEENKKRIIELLGLILIITSFFIFSDTDTWPSYNALMPVFGAYLCILANCKKTLLSNIAFQKIGLWSYSIYLIHWPFIVFFKKINIEISIFTYFISTILLAFIIYSIIEKRRDYSYGLILCWILSVGVSYYVSIDGVGNRVDEKYKLTSKEFHREYFGGSAIKQASVIQEFNIDNNDNPQAIITGDSFSRQYMNSFKKSGFKAIGIFKDGCFITPNYYSKFESNDNRLCKLRYDNFIKVMKEHPKTNVILSMSWGSYKLTDKNTDREIKDNSDSIIINELSELIKIGGHLRKYYIIGRPNGSEKSSFECLARNNLPINRIITHCELFSERKIISINDELKKLETLYNNVTIIDPNDVLCKENECILLDKDGEPIYSDSSHLSIFGANIVVEYILKKIN